jgi:hypothetical protein
LDTEGVLYGEKKEQSRNLLLPWQFLQTYLKEVEQDKNFLATCYWP